jgi:hypothetical protein
MVLLLFETVPDEPAEKIETPGLMSFDAQVILLWSYAPHQIRLTPVNFYR